jgi:hypothetical protein
VTHFPTSVAATIRPQLRAFAIANLTAAPFCNFSAVDEEALFRRRLQQLVLERYGSLDRFYLETDFSKRPEAALVEPVAILLGGGLDKIDKGMEGRRRLWKMSVEEYLQRCDRAG